MKLKPWRWFPDVLLWTIRKAIRICLHLRSTQSFLLPCNSWYKNFIIWLFCIFIELFKYRSHKINRQHRLEICTVLQRWWLGHLSLSLSSKSLSAPLTLRCSFLTHSFINSQYVHFKSSHTNKAHKNVTNGICIVDKHYMPPETRSASKQQSEEYRFPKTAVKLYYYWQHSNRGR